MFLTGVPVTQRVRDVGVGRWSSEWRGAAVEVSEEARRLSCETLTAGAGRAGATERPTAQARPTVTRISVRVVDRVK